MGQKKIVSKLFSDGYVNVDDVLDVFSDYTGEDIFKASESADFLQHRQCPQTGAEQIKVRTLIIANSRKSHVKILF